MSYFEHTVPWLYARSVLLAALGVTALAVGIAVLARSRQTAHARSPGRKRIPSAARSFARLLESHGFDSAIALATYCYLDESRGGIHPIQPGDNLERDLLLTPEQIEHTLLALMALLGRKPSLNWRRQPIATVEDLIGVLQAARPTNTRVAA